PAARVARLTARAGGPAVARAAVLEHCQILGPRLGIGSPREYDWMAEVFAALLRGVNVGGRGKLSMPDLVRVFESLEHDDVKSYIQSGNVVFRSADSRPASVSAALERAIADRFGLETRVILRTHSELEAIAAGSPFADAVHVV